MARTNEIPDSERQIGVRLRQAREGALASQTSFALKAGIGRERLASYENGYVPLPWNIGDLICDKFNLSAQWLVEGKGPVEPFFRPLEIDRLDIPKKALFSEVYQESIAPYYSARLSKQRVSKMLAVIDAKVGRPQSQADPDIRQILRQLETASTMLTRKEKWALYDDLRPLLSRYWMKAAAEDDDRDTPAK